MCRFLPIATTNLWYHFCNKKFFFIRIKYELNSKEISYYLTTCETIIKYIITYFRVMSYQTTDQKHYNYTIIVSSLYDSHVGQLLSIKRYNKIDIMWLYFRIKMSFKSYVARQTKFSEVWISPILFSDGKYNLTSNILLLCVNFRVGIMILFHHICCME